MVVIGGGFFARGGFSFFFFFELPPIAIQVFEAASGVCEGGPGASAAANLRVIAFGAIAAELFGGEVSVVGKGASSVPDFAQGCVANISFEKAVFPIHGRGKGQASFDAAIAFDTDDGASSGTAHPEGNCATGIAKVLFRFAVVANVMSGIDFGATFFGAEFGEFRYHDQHVFRFQA